MKITNIKQQVKRADRFAIYVDEKYSFSLGESELLASKLKIGDEISETDLTKLKGKAELDKAMDRTLNFVAIRPRSLWEVESYLKRKKYNAKNISAILNKLSKNRLTDDESFARSWVASRRLLKPMSRRRLESELRQKRVSSEIINKVLEEDSVSDISTLAQLIIKKRARYSDDNKFMQFLARQGYNYQDIKEALKKTSDDI